MRHAINISNSLIILISIIGTTLSITCAYLLYQFERKVLIEEFENNVNQRAASLSKEFSINLETTRSLAILFSRNHQPSYEQFDYEAKKILNRYSSIYAFSWVPKLNKLQRQEYENFNEMLLAPIEITERLPQGGMVKASQRDFYFPVTYTIPLIGNESVVGFDLASHPSRLQTLETAQNTATVQITPPITLVVSKIKQLALVAFMPIYQGTPTTLVQRQAQIRGFVNAVFIVEDIFKQSALTPKALGIDMQLIDVSNNNEELLLYSHKSRSSTRANSSISYQVNLSSLAGRQWALKAQPTTHYLRKHQNYLSLLFLATGLLFTTIISLYLFFLSKQTAVIKQLVIEKTKHLHKANLQLKKLTEIDPLTKIFNRRKMDTVLNIEWRRAIRNNQAISIMLIDIDFFKLYNDNYGHPAGDLILKEVAQTLKTIAKRTGDLAVRYGGEEFALILPNTNCVEKVAENCLEAIRKLQIPHAFSPIEHILTVSIGHYSLYPTIETQPSLLITLADKALYKAKADGRNCIYKLQPDDL